MTEPTDLVVCCTFFPSLFADVSRTMQTNWVDLCNYIISTPHCCVEKESAPMINFARYVDKAPDMKAHSVADVGVIGIDVDRGDFEAVNYTTKELNREGVEYLFQSTWSCDVPHGIWKARFWVPLSTPVSAREYKTFFNRLYARFAPNSDHKVCDPSRRFFQYSHHPARKPFARRVPGRLLAPSDLAAVLSTLPAQVSANREISREIASKLARRWSKQKNPATMDLGDRLLKVCEGLPFAAKGERDTILFGLVSRIVEAYPDVADASVAELFGRSLDVMAAEDPFDCITRELVRAKVVNARTRVVERRDVTSISPKRVEDMRQFFAGDRQEPYSIPEIHSIADSIGVTADQLAKCWIVAADKTYYVLGGPKANFFECSKESLENVYRVVLAPAPVQTYVASEEGVRLQNAKALLELHSTPIREVKRSMIVQAPALDLKSATLTIPVCPRRELTPRYDQDVARWLYIIGGASHDGLLAWLHFVTDLTRPLAALVMIGSRSAGKSLLIRGLTRIWTTGTTPTLADLLGNFNSGVEECPIVASDESLPKDSRGREPIAQLRQLIQSTSRTSNKKYRVTQSLEGAIRLILASNSHSILTIHDALSGDDAPAFAERLFEIHATSASLDFLNSIGGRPRIDPEWIEQDYLARHILWLVENHNVPWVGRFGVAQNSSDLANRLIVRGGLRSQLCEFFVRGFNERVPFERNVFIRTSGRIFAHIECITQSWDRIMRRQNQPPTSAIAGALSGISLRRVDVNGALWYEIDQDKLALWAKDTGYSFGR